MKKYFSICSLFLLLIVFPFFPSNANAGEIVAGKCTIDFKNYSTVCSSDIPAITSRIRYNESWLKVNGVAQYNPADGKPADIYGFPVNAEDYTMAGIPGNSMLSVYRNKNNKANAKFTTGPAGGPKIVRSTVELNYDNTQEPTGWNLNIGDSMGNNGWGGDDGSRENDAEITLNAKFFQVFGNDFTPANTAIDGHRKLYEKSLGSMKGEYVIFEIKDNFVSWNFRNNSNVNGSMNSIYLYALNGQKDAGGTDSNIYVDFNNTLLDYDRNGTGVINGTITLYTTSEELAVYENKLKAEKLIEEKKAAEEKAALLPRITTKDASGIGAQSAVINGTYGNIWLEKISSTNYWTWFHYGTDPNNLSTEKTGNRQELVTTRASIGNSSTALSKLNPNTTYYFKYCGERLTVPGEIICGEVKSFKTSGNEPIVITENPSQYSPENFAIRLNGTYQNIYVNNKTDFSTWFHLGTDPNNLPTTKIASYTHLLDSSPTTQKQSRIAEGIQKNKTYYYKTCASGVNGTNTIKCGEVKTFSTFDGVLTFDYKPIVKTESFATNTLAVDNITTNSAIVYGSINSTIVNTYDANFIYGTDSTLNKNTNYVSTAVGFSSPGAVVSNVSAPSSASLTGLLPDTTYYFKSCFNDILNKAGGGIKCGAQMSFKTLPEPKKIENFTVTTNPVTEITHNSARLHGLIENIYFYSIDSGFDYDSSVPFSSFTTEVSRNGFDASVKGPIRLGTTSVISNLFPDTTYTVKAWGVQNKDSGTRPTFGQIVSFKTLPIPVFTPTTIEATDITTNSAVLNSKIENLYGKNATLNFKVSPNASFEAKYGYIPTETKTIKDYKNPENISYATQIKDLSYNRTYYFKICGQNDLGHSACGKTLSFTTPSPASTKLITVTEGASSITTDSATLYGYANNIYDYTYKGRFEYGIATTLGTNTNYVGVRILKQPDEVFQNANITNLKPDTTYYYHYCASGMANTPSSYVCGETKTFKTPAVQVTKDFSTTTTQSKVLDKNTATLIGDVWSIPKNDFNIYFEYGKSISLGSNIGKDDNNLLSVSYIKVDYNQTTPNLEANTLYYYRICAKDVNGLFNGATKCGEIKTFKTPEDFGQLCRIETYTAAYNKYWDIDETQFNFKKLHPEIKAYRIKWWNDKGWSEWFTPTINDVDPKNPVQNQSDYFQDHIHQVEICGNDKYKPQGESVLISSELAVYGSEYKSLKEGTVPLDKKPLVVTTPTTIPVKTTPIETQKPIPTPVTTPTTDQTQKETPTPVSTPTPKTSSASSSSQTQTPKPTPKTSYNFGSVNLYEGSTGSAVKDLQRFLGIEDDGIFGPITKASLLDWQKKNNLVPDGIMGPISKAKAYSNLGQ